MLFIRLILEVLLERVRNVTGKCNDYQAGKMAFQAQMVLHSIFRRKMASFPYQLDCHYVLLLISRFVQFARDYGTQPLSLDEVVSIMTR